MRYVVFAIVLCSQLAGQTPGPLTDAILARYNAVKQNLIEAAELMPAENYTYKLTPAQRTFAGWMHHTMMLNQNSCSAIKGVAAKPMDHSAKDFDAEPKAQAVAALKESYAFCDEALKGMTDQRFLGEVSIDGKKSYPVTAALGLIATSNSHYGNVVGYLRSKGLVPPSTARQQKR
jgi:hypothetical protein